jgi:DNA damage-inducible protein 1
MLYVNTEVNDVPVKAFVDSGAQATIMSPDCAQRCGIMRLMDTRYSGMARGVGTARILGRVHHAEIKIGGAVMPCAFTVMEGKDVDLLFGLDMLKRYKAKIDLEKNALCFEGLEVPFLPESEIPKGFEEGDPTVPGPNNTEISATSGAVKPANNPDKNVVATGQPPVSQPATATAQPPAPPPSNERFPPEHIDQLVSLGFSRQDAIQALHATGGNVEFAASLLFSQQ